MLGGEMWDASWDSLDEGEEDEYLDMTIAAEMFFCAWSGVTEAECGTRLR